MTTTAQHILHIDMDNVLVNFQSGLDRVGEELKAEYGVDNYDNIPGIFDRMDPVEGAIDAYRKLSARYDTFILSTAPWGNPSAWRSKVEWVHRHLGDEAYKRLTITHRKDLVFGHYLIDDRPNNGAKDFKGEWIHFASPRFPDWASVLDYLL